MHLHLGFHYALCRYGMNINVWDDHLIVDLVLDHGGVVGNEHEERFDATDGFRNVAD